MIEICKVKIYDMRLSYSYRPNTAPSKKTIERNFNRRIVCPHFLKTLNKSIKTV